MSYSSFSSQCLTCSTVSFAHRILPPGGHGSAVPLQLLHASHCCTCISVCELNCSALSLSEFRVRSDRNHFFASTQTIWNIANMFCLALSGLREGSKNWATSSWLCSSAQGGNGARVSKTPQDLLPFWMCLFFNGHLLSFCRSLTTLQSAYKVILVNVYFPTFPVENTDRSS